MEKSPCVNLITKGWFANERAWASLTPISYLRNDDFLAGFPNNIFRACAPGNSKWLVAVPGLLPVQFSLFRFLKKPRNKTDKAYDCTNQKAKPHEGTTTVHFHLLKVLLRLSIY